MKKVSRLLPVFAIAAGVALAAVTSAFKEAPKNKADDDLYTFEYVPPSGSTPYSVGNVENKGHWMYVAGNNDGCESGEDQACRIFVSSDFVQPSGVNNYTLKSNYSITADESATNVAYVSATSDTPTEDDTYISNTHQ